MLFGATDRLKSLLGPFDAWDVFTVVPIVLLALSATGVVAAFARGV
ncbi:MAG TPA: hypothetical protein VFN64_07205 [Burkholderiaceae bacterium]|nr:hypothetical protein [Burkholderiaceae bacterium]